MAYIVMAYTLISFESIMPPASRGRRGLVMAFTVTAYIVKAYIVMAFTVTPYIVKAFMVMAYMFMAYVVMCIQLWPTYVGPT